MNKQSLLCVLTAGTALWMAPLAAHHNSPMSDSIPMPDQALEVHNAAIESVLERLDDMGVAGMMAGERSSEMDPADNSTMQGPGAVPDSGGETYQPGMERAPHL